MSEMTPHPHPMSSMDACGRVLQACTSAHAPSSTASVPTRMELLSWLTWNLRNLKGSVAIIGDKFTTFPSITCDLRGKKKLRPGIILYFPRFFISLQANIILYTYTHTESFKTHVYAEELFVFIRYRNRCRHRKGNTPEQRRRHGLS